MHQGEGGPRTPFFLVAGMFGNVLNLRHLAHLLGTDRPFYGLQARGLYGDEEPHETFEEAAADYIAELRTVQPHGPYLLGGFSGGGITAYEMARQLEADGEEVALLVMLDTPLPMRPPLTRRDRALIKWQQLRAATRLPPATGRGTGSPGSSAGCAGAAAPKPTSTDATHQFHDEAIEAAFRGALPLYRLHRWDGPLALFRPALDRHWKVSRRPLGRQRARVRLRGQRLDPLGAGDAGLRGAGRPRLDGARAQRPRAGRPDAGLHRRGRARRRPPAGRSPSPPPRSERHARAHGPDRHPQLPHARR